MILFSKTLACERERPDRSQRDSRRIVAIGTRSRDRLVVVEDRAVSCRAGGVRWSLDSARAHCRICANY